MPSVTQRLWRQGVIAPPPHIVHNLHYECLAGSHAYGVASEASDRDIQGFCIPPVAMIFPHLAGVIEGFGDQGQRFDQYQQPHVACEGMEYDISIYGIVKYFRLCADGNPNMIDSLFVPEECVNHISAIGRAVRDARHRFLSKRTWPRFKGMAYEQVKKLNKGGEKAAKYGYHIVRLMDEARQILTTGDIDLRHNSEELKSIRRGDWSENRVRDHFESQVGELTDLHKRCDLPDHPDMDVLKTLLIGCIDA